MWGIVLIVLGIVVLCMAAIFYVALSVPTITTGIVAILGLLMLIIGVIVFLISKPEEEAGDQEDLYGYAHGYRPPGYQSSASPWGGYRFDELRAIPWSIGGNEWGESPFAARRPFVPPAAAPAPAPISDEERAKDAAKAKFLKKLYNTGRCPICGRAVGVGWMACPTCHKRYGGL